MSGATTVNYDQYSGSATLTVLPGDADGDFNDDNVVDGADYNVWLNATPLPGDFDFNGTVEAADYVLWRKGPTALTQSGYDAWRANFGQTIGSRSSALVAVPEPSMFALLWLGAILVLPSLRKGR